MPAARLVTVEVPNRDTITKLLARGGGTDIGDRYPRLGACRIGEDSATLDIDCVDVRLQVGGAAGFDDAKKAVRLLTGIAADPRRFDNSIGGLRQGRSSGKEYQRSGKIAGNGHGKAHF